MAAAARTRPGRSRRPGSPPRCRCRRSPRRRGRRSSRGTRRAWWRGPSRGRACRRTGRRCRRRGRGRRRASQDWLAAAKAATQVPTKPISVSAFGVRPSRPRRGRDRASPGRGRARASPARHEGAGHEAVCSRCSMPRTRRSCSAKARNASGRRRETVSRPTRRVWMRPATPEPAEVPRDERLAEPDPLDELGDGRLALGEALDDPQAVHVGERLVDDAQRAQVVGLVDDGRDGRADVRGGGCQDGCSGCGGSGPRALGGRRINADLYQYALIRRACQPESSDATPGCGVRGWRRAR